MFYNYIKAALRNMRQHRLFATINILGLAVGLSAVMLITLYIWDEMTYDDYFADGDRIYKVEMLAPGPGVSQRPMGYTGPTVIKAMEADLGTMIEAATRIRRQDLIITLNDQPQTIGVDVVDPGFFDVFQLNFIHGNAQNPFQDVHTAALSEEMAIRLFGRTDVIGETLPMDNGNSYKITAVYKNLPHNTHIDPQLLINMGPSPQDDYSNGELWFFIGFRSYIKLKDGVDIDRFNGAIPAMVDRYLSGSMGMERASDGVGFPTIALKDVHFDSARAMPSRPKGNRGLLFGFGAIALTILMIATVNFMNMSISRTVARAREVAIRKIMGAGKLQITQQFLTETLVTISIAFVLAIGLTELCLPWFNAFVAKVMRVGLLSEPMFAGGLVLLLLFVSFAAGAWPASLLAGTQPAKIIRGGRSETGNMSRLRTIIVTVQFAVAIGLIATTLIINLQIRYNQSMDPGFNKENVVLISGLSHPAVRNNIQTLNDQLRAINGVVDTALTDSAPGGTYGWMTQINNIDGRTIDPLRLRGLFIDENFVETYGVQLAAGRALEADRGQDWMPPQNEQPQGQDVEETPATNILVNESAARAMGFASPQAAIGKTFIDGIPLTIVGVIRDYMIGSAKSKIPPMYYGMQENSYRMMAVRYNSNNLTDLLTAIDSTWQTVIPGRPINRVFLDERIENQYRNDLHQGDVFGLFALLAVTVSCFGLYGLSAESVSRRTREVGLRKVMGANIRNIMTAILWDFSKPVLWANLIAWPLVAYFMTGWLQGFEYRIDQMSLIPAAMGAGLIALAIAWLTVGGHVLRAAHSNPIHALRHD